MWRGEATIKTEYDFSRGRRGAIDPLLQGKTRMLLRLDNDIIEWFRQTVEEAGGGDYEALMNEALRQYIQHQSLEEVVRRVVREELQKVA